MNELDCSIVEKIGLAQTIHKRDIRVFAILIKNEEKNLIIKFRKHQVLDAQLFFGKAKAKQIVDDFGVSFAKDYQRQFLPYKFSRDMRDNYKNINESERILSFVDELKNVARGEFGDIFKVKISHSQQEFVLDKIISRLIIFRFRQCNLSLAKTVNGK